MATNYNGALNMDYSTASPFTYREGEYLKSHPVAGDVAVGESTMPRDLITNSSVPVTSGYLRLTYFTAKKTETVSTVRYTIGGISAGATPTLCRIGLYKEEADLSLTLVASTPNDTALFTGTVYTAPTKAFSAPYAKIRGQRYAIGQLIVTAAAVPGFFGNGAYPSVVAFLEPKICAGLSGLSDLPSTIAAGSLLATSITNYAEVLP